MASAADAAQAELASVKEELSAANDASEANVAKITDLEKQLEQKNADLEKSNAEIETIKAEVTEAAEKFKSIEAQCEEQMTKTKSLEDEKEALAAQNAELAAKIASNEDQLQVVNVDDDSAKDTRIGELESEIGTLKEQINQAKSKNEELRERNWKAMDLSLMQRISPSKRQLLWRRPRRKSPSSKPPLRNLVMRTQKAALCNRGPKLNPPLEGRSPENHTYYHKIKKCTFGPRL